MPHTITGPVVDPASAWRLVGDTDHLNRQAGNPPLTLAIHPDDHGFPELRGEILGPGPIRHQFSEVDLFWVSGQRFRQVRELDGQMLRRTSYEVTLAAEGGGVRPTIVMDVVPRNRWMGRVTDALTERGMKRWAALLEALPRPGEPAVDPPVRALTPGTLTALHRWKARGSPDALVDAVGDLYQRLRPRELRELRPFKLAERWGRDPREVLVGFLEATQAGAMELYWSVRCPRCQSGVAAADSLSNLADHGACPSCRITFAPDLESSVEVLFAAPRELRPAADQAFCTLYPAGRPEVLAMMILAPGAEERITVPLPAGTCRLGVGGSAPDQLFDVREGGADRWTWSALDPGGTVELRPGPTTLTLRNPTAHRARVDLSTTRRPDEGVSAALLATMPEYRERFGPVALAADVRIGVRAVAILFTDLTGSAALYHEQGDASAFRFVHEHFTLLDAAVHANQGVRVKTIGDALMASFHSPVDAVRAALQMLDAFDAWVQTYALTRRPGLKVGIHFGPAMAVHTDSAGLDYFGGTVNLAARAQGKAAGGAVVWTASIQSDRDVQELIRATGAAVIPFEAAIKGLPDPLTLYSLTPPAPRLPPGTGIAG